MTDPRPHDDLRDDLRRTYRLEDCCDEALDTVLAGFAAAARDEPVDVRTVHQALTHGAVLEAFCAWVDEFDGIDSPVFGGFAATLTASERTEAAPAFLLRARHREAAGDPLAAEEDLETAVRLDPGFGPAAAELAWYASDRGDAARTVSLLRRAGIGEDDPMLAFHARLGTDPVEVGRNDPCPCGSGRKYKACHLGRPQIPVGNRMNWLLSKLTMFATRPRQLPALEELAFEAAGGDPTAVADRLADPFVMELRLFEGGGIAEFLAARGVLLPDDERDLLERWGSARLALWEVTATDGRERLDVSDTRTGEVLEVSDRSIAGDFEVGDHLAGRFVPAWGRTMATGVTIRLDAEHRKSARRLFASDPDVWDLARWYAGLFTPPELRNRENEPIVSCTARLRPRTSWDDLRRTLDDAYLRDDETETWRETYDLDEAAGLVRAVLRRDGEELVVVTNSVERMDRVVERLAGAAEVVDRSVEPLDPTAASAKTGDALPDSPPLDDQ